MPRAVRTSPRKQAVQARSLATVETLLRATARILIREGYEQASTNKIAKAAGVSIGSLYQYFPSKEALVAALAERHGQHMLEILQKTLLQFARSPLPTLVQQSVRSMIAAHRLEPKLHKVLVEQVPRVAGKASELAKMERAIETFVRAHLEARRAELIVTDLDLAAFVVVNIVESLTHNAVLLRPDLLNESFEDEVSAAVLRYLTGKEQSAQT